MTVNPPVVCMNVYFNISVLRGAWDTLVTLISDLNGIVFALQAKNGAITVKIDAQAVKLIAAPPGRRECKSVRLP